MLTHEHVDFHPKRLFKVMSCTFLATKALQAHHCTPRSEIQVKIRFQSGFQSRKRWTSLRTTKVMSRIERILPQWRHPSDFSSRNWTLHADAHPVSRLYPREWRQSTPAKVVLVIKISLAHLQRGTNGWKLAVKQTCLQHIESGNWKSHKYQFCDFPRLIIEHNKPASASGSWDPSIF